MVLCAHLTSGRGRPGEDMESPCDPPNQLSRHSDTWASSCLDGEMAVGRRDVRHLRGENSEVCQAILNITSVQRS